MTAKPLAEPGRLKPCAITYVGAENGSKLATFEGYEPGTNKTIIMSKMHHLFGSRFRSFVGVSPERLSSGVYVNTHRVYVNAHRNFGAPEDTVAEPGTFNPCAISSVDGKNGPKWTAFGGYEPGTNITFGLFGISAEMRPDFKCFVRSVLGPWNGYPSTIRLRSARVLARRSKIQRCEFQRRLKSSI